jgi:hypothetical protein
MSAENVEIVRRWVEALPDEIRATVAEFCDPDVDYYPVRKFPEAHPCHGQEEFSEFLARFREAWFRYEWAIQELIAVGKDRVMACLELRTEGRESGVNLEGDTLEAAGLRAPSNLDLVRSIRAAWELGDFSSAGWAHPDIEFAFEGGPAPGSWTGLAGMAQAMRDFLSTWDEFRSEAGECRELDDDRVLVLIH